MMTTGVDGYQKSVLDNGIRVVTEHLPHLRSVSLGIWVDVGSRDESDSEGGLTHFIEHMLFKGTARRSALDIAREFDAIGGMANAFTTKENTCVHAKVLDTHLAAVVDVLADIFLNSVFAPEEIERERQVVLQEISMVEETPDDYVHVLFGQTYWDGNPLGRSILGEVDSVLTFTRDKTLAYLDRDYHPERIILSAAGNIDHQRFVDLVTPTFGNLHRDGGGVVRRPPQCHPAVKGFGRNLEQVHFCLGTKAASLRDDSRYACTVLNVILGGSMSSRLFQEVRERRGLAYSIYSFHTPHTDTGLLGIYSAVRPENARPAIEVVCAELRRLKKEAISAAELTEAKEHLKGSMYLSAENSDNRMSRLARNEMYFGRYLPYAEIEAGLEEVTAEDVQALACEMFTGKDMGLVLLGPVDRVEVDNEVVDV